MIAATSDFSAVAGTLKTRAEQLARARAVLMLRRRDARRWRNASLLWPLFGLD